jgi:hypothetical protein
MTLADLIGTKTQKNFDVGPDYSELIADSVNKPIKND